MDCEVGLEATTNRVQRANREGGERRGVALGKGEVENTRREQGTFHRGEGFTTRQFIVPPGAWLQTSPIAMEVRESPKSNVEVPVRRGGGT